MFAPSGRRAYAVVGPEPSQTSEESAADRTGSVDIWAMQARVADQSSTCEHGLLAVSACTYPQAHASGRDERWYL